MTALPDGESSAIAALRKAVGMRAPSVFDWRALVERAQPGDQTPRQRQQRDRLARVQAELSAWAGGWRIAPGHIEASAVFAVGATPPEIPWGQVSALARMIFWVYSIDTVIDDPAIRANRGESAISEALATFDAYLATLLTPAAAWFPRDSWPQVGLRLPAAIDGGGPHAVECEDLARALADLLRHLPDCWAALPASWGRDGYRRAHMARELVTCLTTMRQEFVWDCQPASMLPDVAAYLANGKRSIGVYLITALAGGFERDPRRAWGRALPAIDAGGCVARLANDLHLFPRDSAEGHASAVAVALRAAGDATSAQAAIAAELDRAADRFRAASAPLDDGPLAYVLRHIVAFALAIYGDGSRFRADRDST